MNRSTILLALLLGGAAPALHAASWHYRGTLAEQGQAAEGRFDLRLTLLDANGAVWYGPILLPGVEVRGGQFDAAVELDFDRARAPALRLLTEVSEHGSAFAAIAAAQPFYPDGAAASCWQTSGNLGTNALSDFLGTLDAQPLHLRVNNQEVGSIQGTAAGPNFRVGNPQNNVLNGADSSVVLGGRNTLATANLAVGSNATISGGFSHVAEDSGTVAGGRNNHASLGAFATGSFVCAGGYYSFAAGYRTRVRRAQLPGQVGAADPCDGLENSGDADGDNGTFAWSDDQPADFISTGPRQFLARAGGGFLLNTNMLVQSGDDLVLKARAGGDADSDLRLVTASGKSASMYLRDVDGAWRLVAPNLTGPDFISVQNGARLTAGGTWTNASSRAFKRAITAVDPEQILDGVLELPISTWQYRGSAEGTHIGPMAEDFRVTFGLGDSEHSISTVDADGVALAAIQGLYRKLKADHERLLARVEALEQQQRGAGQ
jgi:hypothetical protein